MFKKYFFLGLGISFPKGVGLGDEEAAWLNQ
jgi:hypothetical protein